MCGTVNPRSSICFCAPENKTQMLQPFWKFWIFFSFFLPLQFSTFFKEGFWIFSYFSGKHGHRKKLNETIEKKQEQFSYGGKRLYHYNEDDFRIHINIEVKRIYQLKSFSLIICKLLFRKKLVNNQNLNKKVVFIVVI